MNEVLQKLFLVMVVVSLFFSGCATTPASIPKSSYTITDDRIEFSYYGLSIMRPPSDYEMQKKLGRGELVVWLSKEANTFITVMATKSNLNVSYDNLVKTFAEITRDKIKKNWSNASYNIFEEREVTINKIQFHQAKIHYEGLSD